MSRCSCVLVVWRWPSRFLCISNFKQIKNFFTFVYHKFFYYFLVPLQKGVGGGGQFRVLLTFPRLINTKLVTLDALPHIGTFWLKHFKISSSSNKCLPQMHRSLHFVFKLVANVYSKHLWNQWSLFHMGCLVTYIMYQYLT